MLVIIKKEKLYQSMMKLCHNCQFKTPYENGALQCERCRSEAVEIIEQPVPQMRPFDLFEGFMRMGFPNRNVFDEQAQFFNSPIQPFTVLRQSRGPVQNFFQIIIQQGPQEEVSQPVKKETIETLKKIPELHHNCAICQETGNQGVELPCKHQFHSACIKPWFETKNTCPCCRETLN